VRKFKGKSDQTKIQKQHEAIQQEQAPARLQQLLKVLEE
jgi:hypothetical protein